MQGRITEDAGERGGKLVGSIGGEVVVLIADVETFYAEPGTTPMITLIGATSPNDSISGSVTGYLAPID